MFNSDAYGEKNLLFKDATSELVPIATQTYEAWLGREYLHAMKGLICDPNRKYPLNLIADWRKTLWQGNTGLPWEPTSVPAWPQTQSISNVPFPPLASGTESNGLLVSHQLLRYSPPREPGNWVLE